MPQVIFKKRTAHLASYTYLQEMLIHIKRRHFHSCNIHQEQLFHRTLIASYFRPVNIAKFLRTAFLKNTSRSNRLHVFFKIGVLKSFTNFTGKHLCWILLLKKLAGWRPATLFKKILQHRYFPVKFEKFLRSPFFTEHLRWLLLHLRYFATFIWRTIFLFSTHRLMYKKSNLFLYKFIVICQVF